MELLTSGVRTTFFSVASVGNTAAICVSINHGLGQHIDQIALDEQHKIQTVDFSRHSTASMWFGLGLILVGFIAARLYYTPKRLFSSDFTFNALDLFILLTVEMHLIIMNAAYPNLLAFLSKTSTGFMNTAQTGSTSGSHNIQGRTESSCHHVKVRNDATSHTTIVANRTQDATSVESFNSQQIMIPKSVMVRHDAGEGEGNESGFYRESQD
ncbi:hypothetical protein B0A54_13438 [Friedmanniomyces endolithicus]|uniref:Uncharacterized protein n=1 Tax=Friedmanniomyces endolithicus TaxID=329885 RepID=A0A4V5N8U7_9PEZI|nr:hypothetical protein B0A54_13438 [Friedmanniomyces endolithicus]